MKRQARPLQRVQIVQRTQLIGPGHRIGLGDLGGCGAAFVQRAGLLLPPARQVSPPPIELRRRNRGQATAELRQQREELLGLIVERSVCGLLEHHQPGVRQVAVELLPLIGAPRQNPMAFDQQRRDRTAVEGAAQVHVAHARVHGPSEARAGLPAVARDLLGGRLVVVLALSVAVQKAVVELLGH